MRRSAQDGRTTPNMFPGETFAGFGPSQFYPEGVAGQGHGIRTRSVARMKREVREQAPKRPGVYGMLNAKGHVIYIGKAKNLRSRLLSYFRENSRNPKAGKILEHTRTLLWEFAPDELASLLRELELIRRFRPRYNVLGQPGREKYYRYVCLGRSPAAYAHITREPTGKELARYGPFVGRDQLDKSVRRLNDFFQLRDCASTQKMQFSNEKRLFELELTPGCLRYELGMCLGPCAAHTSSKQYQSAVEKARDFLDGNSKPTMTLLTEQMISASQNQEYERASAIRDKLADLEWLQARLSTLRASRDQTALVYPLVAHDGRTVWYLLNRGQVWAATWEPKTVAEKKRVAELLELVSRAKPHVGRDCVDSVLLVFAWFRKHKGERAKLIAATDVLARLR
jgi:excinuclease ABC subunit C